MTFRTGPGRVAAHRTVAASMVPLAILLGGIVAAATPASEEPRAGAEARLLGLLLGPTPILDDLRELIDDIGGRPTGSADLERAVEWGAAKFRGAGVDTVRTEEFTLPHTWLDRVERGEVVVPEGREARRSPVRLAAMPFSAATGKAGLEAEVADVGRGDEAGFAAAGGRLQGHWALVHTEPMKSLEDLLGEYIITPGIFARARASGAAGILWISNRPGRLLYRHNATLDGSIFPLPAVVVEREEGLRIARLLAIGSPVRIKATVVSEVRAGARARNVVAEIRGGERPDEVVILGAHLDSWDLGRGANDNGCNVGLVIDVARQIAAQAKSVRPRRTLRFVLYTGEEAGLFGSLGEVRLHREELDRVQAQVIFDTGSGRVTGFSLGGRSDLAPAVDEALAGVAGLGPFLNTPDAFLGTDNYDYLVEGVPNLVANEDGAPYLPDYHAESDTFDKIDARELKAGAAIAGVLVWNLADRPSRFARRQTRAEVEALVKATGLDSQMKTFGLWDDFVSGRRGRKP